MFELKIVGAEPGMNWLEWSASIVGSIAWPVAFFAVAFIFRTQISTLMQKIKTLSWGDKVADFSDRLDELEAVSLETKGSATEDIKHNSLEVTDRFKTLIDISPAAAIVDSWIPVEQRLKEMAEMHGFEINRENRLQTNRLAMLRYLASLGLLNNHNYDMVLSLMKLKNIAAHSAEVSIADAVRFQEFASAMMRELDGAEASKLPD
jgi:hypothetical protein